MLSSTAKNLYWMGRYLQRAKSTARLIEATQRMALQSRGEEAAGVAAIFGMEDEFRQSQRQGGRLASLELRCPLAAGELSIPAALALSILLGTSALAAGWLIKGLPLLAWLAVYMAVSVAYSFRLKAAMVADALVLAMLYTLRLLVGSAAIGVQLSYWLLLFSVFLFLSLAYLKRYIEVRDAPDLHRLVRGRGYVAGDREIIMASGLAAGMVSVLILALFAHEPEATSTYAAPDLLLLLCIPLIYWLNRIWMMARRGEVETDPVAFAVRDRRSLFVGAVMGALFLMAQFGPHISLLAAFGLGPAIVAH